MTVTGTPSRLIEAYLQNLRGMLGSADPAEREEILSSVHEHVHASLDGLGREPTASDVRAILRDLGPAEQVVEAWASGSGAGVVSTVGEGPAVARTLAVATILLAVASLFAVAVPVLGVLLQLAVLIAALVAARRSLDCSTLYRAAAGIAAVGLLVNILIMVTLYASGTESDAVPSPVQDAPSSTQTP